MKEMEPNKFSLQVTQATLKKAQSFIKTSKSSLEEGLQASTIKEEEAEQGKQQEGQSYPGQWKQASSRVPKQWIENGIKAKRNSLKDTSMCNNIPEAASKDAAYKMKQKYLGLGKQTAKPQSVEQTRSGRITSTMQREKKATAKNTIAKRATAETGKNTAQSVMKSGATKAVQGAAAKGVQTTVSATATTAAAGSTAGVALAVKAAAVVAKKAKQGKEKMKAALQSVAVKKEQQKKSKKNQKQQKENKNSGEKTMVLAIGIFLFIVAFIIWGVFLAAKIQSEQEQAASGADWIVEVAQGELEVSGDNVGGVKYREWYGLNGNWCAMFVSWCADQCGYLDSNIMPRTAAVATMKSWYEDKNLYQTKESGYEPKAGDIVIFLNNRSHVGIVIAFDEETKILTTIEGNTGSSGTHPYYFGSRVEQRNYALTDSRISGYGTPAYPEKAVDIPEPYGTEYSYMGWQLITSKTSRQYKLREEAGMNFDKDGFGKIKGCYVIACTTTFGTVGDYIDWELENGTVIHTIVGDIKNQNDEGCNKWGHNNGLCVVEFVVDKESWYGSDKYPAKIHTEWNSRVTRAVIKKNYWDE